MNFADLSFRQRLRLIADYWPVKLVIRITFAFINILLLAALAAMLVLALFNTVGLSADYYNWFGLEPDIQVADFPDKIVIPDGFKLMLDPRINDGVLNYTVCDRDNEIIYINIPSRECSEEERANFAANRLAVKVTSIDLIEPGSIIGHYQFNGYDVYIKNTASDYWPLSQFLYLYQAFIPAKNIEIVFTSNDAEMNRFIDMINQVGFGGGESEVKFIGYEYGNVKDL